MLSHVITRFALTVIGSLTAFYLCIVYLHAVGQITPYQMQHVNWFFSMLLKPITSLDWAVQKTALIAVGAIVLQAFIVAALFRRWGYHTAQTINPLTRGGKAIGASDARLPSHETPLHRSFNDESFDEPAVVRQNEEQRLLNLLAQRAQ